jgi:hypothetical protein
MPEVKSVPPAAAADSPGLEHVRHSRSAAALAALALAAASAVIVFLPPAGRVAAPLHDAVWALLGQASFMLPLGLSFVGLVLIVSSARPSAALPCRRLVGVGLIVVSLLPSEDLLGSGAGGTGLIGGWLSSTLLDLLAGAGTLLALLVVLGLGIWLALDLRLPHARRPADAES